MPFIGTCRSGPLDGQSLRLRREDFLAVDKPAALYWIYRWADAENAANDPADTDYFDLDLSLTAAEIAAGINADGTWDGRRTFSLQVQKDAWASGIDVVAIDSYSWPDPPAPEPEPEPAEAPDGV